MHITSFRLMAISTFIFIANVSAMQQQKNDLSLELVTTRTHFNQFESNELQRLASTSKQFRNKVQKCFPQLWKNILDETGLCLFNRYLKDKDLHPDCIFLHCVYRSDYDAVRWLREHKTIYHLCLLSRGWPIALNGYSVANNKKDIMMIELLGADLSEDQVCYHDYPLIHNRSLIHNHPLIVEAACVGDQNLMKKYYDDQSLSFCDIDLVIGAAIKNKDISLLKELCAHEPFKTQMSTHNDRYLDYVCTKQKFNPENPDIRILYFRPTTKDAIFLKELIDSGCFKPTNALIDSLVCVNLQQGNIGLFDEMLAVLRSTLYKSHKQYTLYTQCTIQ